MIYLNETIYAIEKADFKSRQDRSRACLKKQFLIFMGKHRDKYAARYRFSEELKRYFMTFIYSTNQIKCIFIPRSRHVEVACCLQREDKANPQIRLQKSLNLRTLRGFLSLTEHLKLERKKRFLTRLKCPQLWNSYEWTQKCIVHKLNHYRKILSTTE